MNLVRFASDIAGLLELGSVTLYHDGKGAFWASFCPRDPVAFVAPPTTSALFDSAEEAVRIVYESIARHTL